MSVVDTYLNNEIYSHIMKVYCLVDKNKKHSNVTFGDLPDEGSNSPYFESNIKTEMKWLLNNAVNMMSDVSAGMSALTSGSTAGLSQADDARL